VTGSVAGSFCFLWGWRLLLVGRYPPACCSSRLPAFLLRLVQKVNGAQCQQLSLADLLASWSSVTSLSSAVASWCGVIAAETGGEPAPEIQIDPVAFVSHKAHRPTVCSFCTSRPPFFS
jgi:hypothetical protein